MKQSKLYTTAQNFANKDIQQQLYLAGKEEKKEETIEEAAAKYTTEKPERNREFGMIFNAFKAGATWQKGQTK